MKSTKCIGVAVAACTLLLSSCGVPQADGETAEEQKHAKIEVYAAQDDALLATLDDAVLIDALMGTDLPQTENTPPDGLIPEYELRVMQEKTVLLGENPDAPREYEQIATILTYQGSDQVTQTIEEDVVRSLPLPEDSLTFCYALPEGAHEQLLDAVNGG